MSVKQQGFTIIELLIATAVFSTVLVVLTAGVMSFTRQYYKGSVSNATQAVSRAVVTEIAQSVQFGGNDPQPITSPTGTKGYCVNNKAYLYVLGRQLNGNDGTQAPHSLVSIDTGGTCPRVAPDITAAGFNTSYPSARELLGNNMRVNSFTIISVNNVTSIALNVSYGDYQLLCRGASCGSFTLTDLYAGLNDITCRRTTGSQFCAHNELTTRVVKRVQ